MLIFWLIVGGVVLGVVITIRNQSKRYDAINSTAAQLQNDGFVISKKIDDMSSNVSLIVDDENNKWAILIAKLHKSLSYKYSDLIEYEIFEDGDSLVKGRVGSAIIGGVLFGGVGAIVGCSRSKKVKNTCTSLQIRISVNDLKFPSIVIPLISIETKKDSFIYKSAENVSREFASTLAYIKNKAELELNILNDNNETNSFDDIEKLFDLKQKGIITEQEFEDKKKQLLNI